MSRVTAVRQYAYVGRAGGVLGGGRLPLSLRSAGRHRPTALARSVLALPFGEQTTPTPKRVFALALVLRYRCASLA